MPDLVLTWKFDACSRRCFTCWTIFCWATFWLNGSRISMKFKDYVLLWAPLLNYCILVLFYILLSKAGFFLFWNLDLFMSFTCLICSSSFFKHLSYICTIQDKYILICGWIYYRPYDWRGDVIIFWFFILTNLED